MPENIAYGTPVIAAHFAANRRRWEQFYPSERWMIERVGAARRGDLGRVLDVGCACGGLAAALSSRFAVTQYVGVDINRQAIEFAEQAPDIPISHQFVHGDVTEEASLRNTEFETVFNLSCADWNVDFGGILAASWARVAPGGTLIISLRLSDGPGERVMERSYQFIHYDDAAAIPPDAERAAYVVLNVTEALAEFAKLLPARVTGYGYWGVPSQTARTPYQRLAFSVFAVEKRSVNQDPAMGAVVELHFPPDIWKAPG